MAFARPTPHKKAPVSHRRQVQQPAQILLGSGALTAPKLPDPDPAITAVLSAERPTFITLALVAAIHHLATARGTTPHQLVTTWSTNSEVQN
jgi:aryl-alcohol dehydrogenase-like predicted oxidoreductase